MTKKIEARESVGYRATWSIGQGGEPVDITGWTFALALRRVAGAAEITLGMSGTSDPTVQGFNVYNGPTGQLTVSILPASLSGIADTTGDFTMFGDLLGTPPSLPQQFVKAIELRVTTEGPWPA